MPHSDGMSEGGTSGKQMWLRTEFRFEGLESVGKQDVGTVSVWTM